MHVVPILFGSSERRLFGIYHPAVGRKKRRGAVICPPLGNEYLWAHRACRLLAERLSVCGIDVLRFDYFGTGDSAGEGVEVNLAGCIEDTLSAVREIKALSQVNEIALIGLRIGAAIGLSVSGASQNIQRLVLWDPVLQGIDYLEELTGKSSAQAVGDQFAKGFPLSKNLQDELLGLRPKKLQTNAQRILVVVSQESSQLVQLEGLVENTVQCEVEMRLNRPVWMEEADLGVGAVPVDILERIVEWLQ